MDQRARTARRANKLNDRWCRGVAVPGLYADGGNLYLQVTPAGSRSWVFRYRYGGRTRDMGLGPLHTVGLADARAQARQWRRCLLDGLDPIEERDKERQSRALAAAKALSFRACSDAYITAMGPSWRNDKHRAQWETTLRRYADPVMGELPVAEIDTPIVLRVLEPHWSRVPETASRLRGRIEKVLDWARARGYRQGENPARWRGHLDQLLPRRSKIAPVRHYRALPFQDMREFCRALRTQPGPAARAFEFLILTAARTAEVLRASWSEIDLEGALWTVPAARMKSARDHRVPLSPAAVQLLQAQRAETFTQWVFPSLRRDAPLSSMALLMALRRMGRPDITAHGFRSTFRDWSAETTDYAREVAEAALAHAVGDKVEAAYRRGDLFGKRRALMADWSRHCGYPDD